MDFFLILLMSCDSLLACMACGARGISLERGAAPVIALTGTLCLSLSFCLSRTFLAFLPESLFHLLSSTALLLLALSCLLESGLHQLVHRLSARRRTFCVQLYGVRFSLQFDPAGDHIDPDASGTLSPQEAFLLALPLSLDSLLTGLSIRFVWPQAIFLFLFSFCCGFFAAHLGSRLGQRLGRAAGRSAGLCSGITLLLIALLKLYA